MKRQVQLLLVFVCFYYAGCLPTNAILTPEYKSKKISGKNLTIIRLFDDPVIDNSDDVIDDLGSGEPIEVYLSYFDKTFTSTLDNSNCFNKIYFTNNISQTKLEKRELDIGSNEKMKILLPTESSSVEGNSIKSEYLLFIDKLKVYRKAGSSGTMFGTMRTGGSFPSLNHQIYFALWDNIKGTIISYGHVEDESVVIFAMTKSNWESAIQELTKKILKYSPFVNPYLAQ